MDSSWFGTGCALKEKAWTKASAMVAYLAFRSFSRTGSISGWFSNSRSAESILEIGQHIVLINQNDHSYRPSSQQELRVIDLVRCKSFKSFAQPIVQRCVNYNETSSPTTGPRRVRWTPMRLLLLLLCSQPGANPN